MSSKETSNEIAIKVEHVGKTFEPQSSARTIKEGFIGLGRKLSGKKKLAHHKGEYTALKDISFEVKKGDFLGIVGRNGCGKSTLLKIISGIYTPTKGTIKVNGKLTPFIELGVGFNPELSGRDNVFLNGALLGFSRQQMEEMYNDIVDFAELHDFMDTKLKNYSSGMQVRLAFSVAIRANSDILVLDEVLAVGDEAFQRKCYSYFAELKRNKKTVILVTHSMDSVQQFCNNALLIDGGIIIKHGNPALVASKYVELNRDDKDNITDTKMNKPNKHGLTAQARVNITQKNITFTIQVTSKTEIDNAVIALIMNRESGEMVYRWSTDHLLKQPLVLHKNKTANITLDLDNIFPDGKYDIQLAIKKIDRSVVYAMFNRILVYSLTNNNALKRDANWKPGERAKYEQR